MGKSSPMPRPPNAPWSRFEHAWNSAVIYSGNANLYALKALVAAHVANRAASEQQERPRQHGPHMTG